MFWCAVFCVADIPTSTLDKFLEETREHLISIEPLVAEDPISNYMMVMTSKDIDSLKEGVTFSKPPFVSPFLGNNLAEVGYWFMEKISGRSCEDRYMLTVFIILDERSVQDNTCLVACSKEAGGSFDSVRCDFYHGYTTAMGCECRKPMSQGLFGCFMRSGRVITRENWKLAQNEGRYVEGGRVKMDLKWRNFSRRYAKRS